MLFSETETAKQNQKFPFHFFSASRWRGGGRRREKNARKFFGFCTRESASVSEVHSFASPRNRSVRRGLEPLRAPCVRLVLARIVLEKSSNFIQQTQQDRISYYIILSFKRNFVRRVVITIPSPMSTANIV